MATFATNAPMEALTGTEIIPGAQDGIDKRTTTGEIARVAPITALAIASGVVNIDLSLGRHFTLTLTQNASLTVSNLPASGFAAEFALRIQQDATGGRTFTLPSSFKATGGSDTAVASAANAVTLLTAMSFNQGTSWAYAMQDVAA